MPLDQSPAGDAPGEEAAPSRRLLTHFGEYTACLGQLITGALGELLIFDPDARRLELQETERIEALFRFLRGAPTRRIAMVVHESHYLEADCPRFLRLVQQFGGQVEVRVTCGQARRAEDCFVVADSGSVLRRTVAAQPRGVLCENDPAAAADQRERFAQIWRETEPALAPGPLGL
jgi:hypothetical protein